MCTSFDSQCGMVRNVFRNVQEYVWVNYEMFGNVSEMFRYFMPLLVHITGTATKRAVPVLLIPTCRNNP